MCETTPIVYSNNYLTLPDGSNKILEGYIVQLSRFSNTKWEVKFGWIAFGGNRKFCMWYLQNVDNPAETKPLQDTDLYDIYFIEM